MTMLRASGLFGQGKLQTGNPVIDAVLNLGGYAVVAVAAFLIVKYLYTQREQDWEDFKKAKQGELDSLKAAWVSERTELIEQRKRAQEQSEEFRRTAERAAEGIKSVMEVTNKEAMGALKESQTALGEAASRVSVQAAEINQLRQEVSLMQRLADRNHHDQ